MDKVNMWRGIALGMTALAMTSIAVTLAGAGPFASVPAQTTPPAGDQADTGQYEWSGVIYWDSLEGGHWAIKTECGLWALTTDDVETQERIKKYEGQWVSVWGSVFDGASIVMRQTIKVDSVFGKGDPRPMTLVAIPDYCATHGGTIPEPVPTPTPYPTYPPYYYGGNSFVYVLNSVLQGLTDKQMGYVSPDTQFDRYVGAQVTVIGLDGKETAIKAAAGVVVSNDGKTLVLDQNGPAGQSKYAVDGVEVLRANGGRVSDIKAGDKVVVVTQNDTPVVVIASTQVTVWPEYYGEPRPLPAWDLDVSSSGGGFSSRVIEAPAPERQ